MIIEMRTYLLKPAKLKIFLDIYNKEIRETHVSILGNQIGFFYTEFGDLNKVVHLYGYESFEDRDKRRAILAKNKEFLNYLTKVENIIVHMKNEILLPAEFSKIK
tara:strand:+ start:1157 stop:1471 length:315 start_codon:yes stop_codon:yes gene_type:complete